MDFSWSKEQLEFRRQVIAFAETLNDGYEEREKLEKFPAEQWKRCGEFGLLGLLAPKSYGGSEKNALDFVLAMEAMGYGCRDTGLLFGINAQILSVQAPLLVFGTEEQKQRYVPDMISGKRIGCHAVSEYEAGSDVHSPQTRAVAKGDHYIINGQKTWNTNAPVADVFLILTSVDPALGDQGLTTFLMERDTPGLSVRGPFEKMGTRTAMMGEVTLKDCVVPKTSMLGKIGSGSAIFANGMQWERAFILAPAIGAMQRQLEQCIQFAKTRHQFGRAIGKNQSVSNMLVDMHMRLETSRLLLYRAAWMKSQGKRLTTQSSEVKLQISESWVANSRDAIQIHGARGYLTEYGVERQLRDAIGSRIYSGTSEIQKVILASYLGL